MYNKINLWQNSGILLFRDLHMRDQLELVVIGDDDVRHLVYRSLSRSVQEKYNKALHSFNRNNDAAVHLSESTHAEFTLTDRKIHYGIHEYTNARNSLRSPSSYLQRDNLTIVVCINAIGFHLADERFDEKINQLKTIRNHKPFNIIRMMVTTHNYTFDCETLHSHLWTTHSPLCRGIITVNSNELEDPESIQHLSIVLSASLATPFYTEVQNCIKQLKELNVSLQGTDILSTPRVLLADFLDQSLQIMGDGEISTQNALRTHFDQNRAQIQIAFTSLRDSLATQGVYHQTYYRNIALNILCSMAAIVACLTIIGAFFIAHALKQNMRYHNNYCKFFATNDVDEKRAMIAKLEDHMISTENTLQR